MSDLDHDHRKKQKLVDLIKEIAPPAVANKRAARAASPTRTAKTPTPPWAQGNHSFIINGGSVSIHLAAPTACPMRASSRHE